MNPASNKAACGDRAAWGAPGGFANPPARRLSEDKEGTPCGLYFQSMRHNMSSRETRNGLRDRETLGERWSAALLARYPDRHRAKVIANDFGVDPRTATGWLGGSVPDVRHLVLAGHLFGERLLAEVLAPGSAWHQTACALDTLSAVAVLTSPFAAPRKGGRA